MFDNEIFGLKDSLTHMYVFPDYQLQGSFGPKIFQVFKVWTREGSGYGPQGVRVMAIS